ncbi:MAG: hypothetical protein H6R09_439 [Proteobacteria bacterium]|nr:hypothetical protein [Pseudomonadota bacterium]
MREGFTCCNLHYESACIGNSNFGSLPFIPAGTPVNLKSCGRNRLHVDLDGKAVRIGLDTGGRRKRGSSLPRSGSLLKTPGKNRQIPRRGA